MKRILTIAAIAVLLTVGAGASTARADAVSDLMAQIATLQAQIAALSGGSSASAGYSFNNNLTIGSTGADVTQLQTWLESKGFLTIPAGVTKGYFGQLTKKAVIAYQTSAGISPASGFVGPVTRGRLNASGSVATPVPGAPVVTPTVGLDNTDGSVTASLSSYASNVTIKKGETKDLVAVKLQATAGKVAVTRFDVRFNKRPWLYFNTIALKDSNGATIATKTLNGESDATEITVGSDYLVRFEGINAVVTPGTDKVLVVSGSVLSTTDKLSSDVDVIVSVPNSSIRTVNGKGFTDSIGLGTVAQSGTTGRTATLSSTGSTGNILGRISPNTPNTGIVNTSGNGETAGVVLGAFDFKSENRDSTINTLTFTLKDNSGNRPFSTIFKRVYLVDGSTTYQVDSVATSSVFSNLTIKLAQDQWKTLTLKADVADQDDFTDGAMASSTITINTTNVVGIDSGFTTVTASGGNAVTSNDITFLRSGASITSPSATYAIINNGTSASVAASVKMSFTFNNTGSNNLYISKTAALAFATSSTITQSGPVASSTLTLIQTSPSTVAGDTSALYSIPSGTSRSFVVDGNVSNKNGTQGLQEFKITKVYFADDTTNTQEFNINFGLENLRVTPTI